MKRFLLPLFLASLAAVLSSCEYGIYCNVRNATTAPLKVTAVESIIQDKNTTRRSRKPNPALDSFTLVAEGVPGIEYNKAVLNNYYVYTLPAGRAVNVASGISGRLLSRVIITQNTDTISSVRHWRNDQADDLAYYVTIMPNNVTEKRLPQRKR